MITMLPEMNIDLFYQRAEQEKAKNKSSWIAKGYINVYFTNMNGSGAPVMVADSQFEYNSVGETSTTDTAVTGTPVNNAQNYVYYNGTSLIYSNTAPAWSAVKGGWYSGNNRALLKFTYFSGAYNGKVILDRYAAMYELNTNQSVPTTGGVLVDYIGGNGGTDDKNLILEKGKAYRFVRITQGGNGLQNGRNEAVGGDSGVKKEYVTEILEKSIDLLLSMGTDVSSFAKMFSTIGPNLHNGKDGAAGWTAETLGLPAQTMGTDGIRGGNQGENGRAGQGYGGGNNGGGGTSTGGGAGGQPGKADGSYGTGSNGGNPGGNGGAGFGAGGGAGGASAVGTPGYGGGGGGGGSGYGAGGGGGGGRGDGLTWPFAPGFGGGAAAYLFAVFRVL